MPSIKYIHDIKLQWFLKVVLKMTYKGCVCESLLKKSYVQEWNFFKIKSEFFWVVYQILNYTWWSILREGVLRLQVRISALWTKGQHMSIQIWNIYCCLSYYTHSIYIYIYNIILLTWKLTLYTPIIRQEKTGKHSEGISYRMEGIYFFRILSWRKYCESMRNLEKLMLNRAEKV